MSLAEYKKKRRFGNTPEPSGRLKSRQSKKLEFVIHKHDASHLHYDFRLEMDGVLKSWAVPKGPSLKPEDKRLAMMVEDHPYEYRKFEGVIPSGNYGAGNVIIWDKGWYEPRVDTSKPEKTMLDELEKGHLTFVMHGQKLNGEFALIKNPNMGKNAWLLIKKGDNEASERNITQDDKSVVSGRRVDEVDKQPVELDLSNYPKAKIPRNIKPMLATLTDEAFDKSGWLYEIKWDGYRALASWDGREAELYSRNGNNFSGKYPEIFEQLGKLGHQVAIDGEIVAVDKNGRSHFEWLQNWGNNHQGQLIYYVFDILWCDGYDLTGASLINRKKILKEVIDAAPASIHYSDHILDKGQDFFEIVTKQSLEGIMAKDSQSRYQLGRRSKQWLKIKTHQRQEVVIGGYTEPQGSRKDIGALVLGVYDGDELIYVGHTGGGIPPKFVPELRKILEALERQTSPFANKFKPNAPVHWATPKLVCEVSFAEWTSDGHMRQPIFVGMRPDKPAKNVVKELAVPAQATVSRVKSSMNGKPVIEFSHRDKIFFPKPGYTKGDLIDYYQSVSKIMMPYLKDRPCNLLRQPNGLKGQAFFQKDMESHPDWVQTVTIYSESNQKDIHYMVCNSEKSLLYMVQLGSIEINPWSSRVEHIENPDWIVIDLDPEDIGFDRVVDVALAARKVLDTLGIESYPKTSGKTGIHIFIPLGARYAYDQGRQFGEILANLIHTQIPAITSLERNPKKRQKKVYIDFLQNREGQTLAAPYSVRPTDDATVSTPLKWEEVNHKLDPISFTIKTINKRLDEVGDLWKPVLGRGIDIPKILQQISDQSKA